MKKTLFALIALSASLSHAGIVAEYRFDQTTTNSVGAGYALSELGGSGSYIQDSVWGNTQYALSLTAAQGLAADMSAWTGNSDTYTIVMDVNLTEAVSYQKILSFDDANASDSGLYVESSDLIYYGGALSETPGDYVAANTWVRLAMVRSGNQETLYVGTPDAMHVVASGTVTDPYAQIGSTLTFLQNDSQQSGEDYALKVSGIWISDSVMSADRMAAIGDYAPERLLYEDFESLNGGDDLIPVGSNVASAVAIDPDFSPATSGDQDEIEVGMGGEYWNAFGNSTAIDLNTVGLQWSFTVPTNRPNVQLAFDYGHDADTQSTSGSAILYRVLDADNGNAVVGMVFESSVIYDRTSHYTSPTATLRPGGNYIVQVAADRYERFGGCMIDNVAIYAYPATVSVETWDITSDYLLASEGGTNPNGQWSYGWSQTDFSGFELLTDNTSNWKRSGNENVIWKNGDAAVAYGVAPGQVSLHPGNEPTPTMLRWTAPEMDGTGTVHVAGAFFDGDSGVLDTAVRFNNSTSLWSGTVGTFDLNFNVVSGDTIDFAVYGTFAYGNTPIDAQIALTVNASDPDTDGDGINDLDEQQIIDADDSDHINTLADVLPGDDFDRDGRTNLEESQDGTDPTNAGSTLGLVAYYPFDGNADDASRNAMNIGIHGDPMFTNGVLNQCIEFDGNGDYYSSDLSFTSLENQSFSVSLWTQAKGDAIWQYMAGYTDIGSSGYGICRNDNDVFSGTVGTGSSWAYALSDSADASDHDWHLVTISRIDNTTRIYVDGIVQSNTTDHVISFNSSHRIRIGWSGYQDQYYSGRIDDVRIYDRALSSTEVARLYNNTTPSEEVVYAVVSDHGSPIPAAGVYTNDLGTTVAFSVDSVTDGGTQYEPIGWTLYGNEPSSGSTNWFSTTLTNNAALVWNWETNYWLDVTISGNGSVSHDDDWYAADSTQTLTATPDSGWVFAGWSGDASGSGDAVVSMDGAKAATAIFTLDDAINTGFEDDTVGEAPPAPWLGVGGNDSVSEQLSISDTLAHSGSQSLCITNNSYDTAVYPVMIPYGESASFSVWIRPGMHTANYESLGYVGVHELDQATEYWDRNASIVFENNIDYNGVGGVTQFSVRENIDGAYGTLTGDFNPQSWYRVDCEISASNMQFVAHINTGAVTNNIERFENYRIDQIVLGCSQYSITYFDDFSYTPAPPPPNENLLLNPGLDTDLSDWTTDFGTPVLIDDSRGYDGYLFYFSEASNGQIHQDVDLISEGFLADDINAGRHGIIFGGWQNSHEGIDEGQISVTFLDASARELGTVSLPANAPTTWTQYMQTNAIPAQTTTLRYVFAGTMGSGGNSLNVNSYLDDAYLDVIDWVAATLTVASEHGDPDPQIGANEMPVGATVSCSVDAVIDSGTQYEPIGWTLSGNEPASGTTNWFETTLTNDATLIWNWETNYWLDVTISGNGSVNHADGWYAAGSTQNLIATPDEGWIFTGWTGDASGDAAAVLTMDGPKALTAVFALDSVTEVELEVESDYGYPLPAIGTNVFESGTTITCSVDQVTIGSTNYIPTGWTLAGNEPAAGTTNWFTTTLTNTAVLTWNWQAVYVPTISVTNTVVLLEDDFNDGSLDASKWGHMVATGTGTGFSTGTGTSLTESGGTLNIAQAATDRGGAYKTMLLSVNSEGKIVIERRTKVHYANSYTTMAEMLVDENGTRLLRWMYGNYSYNSKVFMGFGGYYSTRLPGLWDQWFDETITYDPVTGLGTMSINGGTPVAIAGAPLSEGSDQVYLVGGAYGWFTGHTKQIDSFRVSQQDIISTPSQVSLNVASAHGTPSPAVGSTTFTGGTTITCAVDNVVSGDLQYECIGWTASGSIPATGAGNQVITTLTEDSSIIWLWQTNVWLDVNITGSGSTSDPAGWYQKDSVLDITALPDTGWLFMNWGGDASGTGTAALTMDSAKSITALFSDDADDDGLTNTQEDDLGSNPRKADSDDDGFSDLVEAQHGLSPTVDSSAIIDYIEANPEVFGITTSTNTVEVGDGEILVETAGNTGTLSLQLEESADLIDWTNTVDAVEWQMPVDQEVLYIRLRSAE